MGMMNNKEYHAIVCLAEYRSNRSKYLPMIDHERKCFPEVTETDDINIGWDCGFIGNRPYFLECWAPPGLTMMTVFLSVKGIENYQAEALERLLIEEARIFSKKPGYESPSFIPIITDDSGNEFFSINILVGINDHPALIDGGGRLCSFQILNEING